MPGARYPRRWSVADRLARRLESYAFATAPERIAVMEGLRAATAVAAMIAVAVWLDRPELSWAAFGAFWACLADPGGKDSARFGFMGLFAAAGAVTAFVASAAASAGSLLAVAALLLLVFLPSLSATYGAAAAQVGILVSVVAVVAITFPGTPYHALYLAGLFLLGCAWAMILCVGIWRIHPRAPARRALAAVFARLGSLTSDLLALHERGATARTEWSAFNAEHRRAVRAAMERARTIVHGLEAGGAPYRREIEIAERIFAALIAAGHRLGERDPSLGDGAERGPLRQLRLLLAEAARQVARRKPQTALLSGEAAALRDESRVADTIINHAIAIAARALQDLADVSRDGAPLSDEDPVLAPSPRSGVLLRPIPDMVLRHAARISISVVVAFAIAVRLDLTFSYWATMATVVILQPLAASTWPRCVERMIGSVAGGLLAVALMLALPTKLMLLAVIFPIAAATIAFRLVNYTIFVVFLTSLFVLVTELLQPASGIASARMINNIIGSLVGVAGSFLLWPDQGGKRTGATLADAVNANIAYAARVIAGGGSLSDLDCLRREAGVASGAAEIMQHRMMLEGQSKRARLNEMAGLLEALRDLAGSATARSLAGESPDPARAAALMRFKAALADAVRLPSRAVLPAMPASEPCDDTDRAIRSVARAASIYAFAHPRVATPTRTQSKPLL